MHYELPCLSSSFWTKVTAPKLSPGSRSCCQGKGRGYKPSTCCSFPCPALNNSRNLSCSSLCARGLSCGATSRCSLHTWNTHLNSPKALHSICALGWVQTLSCCSFSAHLNGNLWITFLKESDVLIISWERLDSCLRVSLVLFFCNNRATNETS